MIAENLSGTENSHPFCHSVLIKILSYSTFGRSSNLGYLHAVEHVTSQPIYSGDSPLANSLLRRFGESQNSEGGVEFRYGLRRGARQSQLCSHLAAKAGHYSHLT
jgi:hypothetical protein